MATQYSQSVIGAVVEIQSSHSTRQRMPHLIGKIGTIKVIPTHPSTWYVIDIPKLGVIRLQPTGFHVVSISNLTTDSKHYNRVMEYISNKKICDNDVANDNIDESEPIDEDDSENAHQNVALLTKGVRVKVLPTTDVMHRLPYLIGKTGIIKEIPLHHIHWYKVELDDGTIISLRPSALQLSNDDSDNAIKTDSSTGGSNSEESASNLFKLKAVASNDSIVSVSSKSGQKIKRKLLSDTDPETWVGRKVKIIKEKLVGSIGVVLRSGNGWVQVETDCIEGEIAKRAYELEIIVDQSSMDDLASLDQLSDKKYKKAPNKGWAPYAKRQKLKLATLGSNTSKVKSGGSVSSNLEGVGRRSNTNLEGLGRRSSTTTTTNLETLGKRSSNLETLGKRSSSNLETLGKRSSSNLDSLGKRSSNLEALGKRSSSNLEALGRRSSNLETLGRRSSNLDSLGRRSSSNLETLGRAADPSPVNDFDESEAPTPLLTRSRASSIDMTSRQDLKISVALRELKRQLTQKYVDRHQETIATRPDLMYWLHHLQAGMVDSEYDRQVAKEFEDTYCENCFTEKWPNSTFCWNKMCSISPIYWEKFSPDERPNDIEFHRESIHRSADTPRLNVVSDFLISVPSRLIGVNRDTETFDSLDEVNNHSKDKDEDRDLLPTTTTTTTTTTTNNNNKKKKLESSHSNADSEQSLKRSRVR